MKASTRALALATVLPTLCAQDKPAAGTDLPQLRAAFAAANLHDPAVVIAVVPGREPVILTVGSDAAGKDLTPQTLVPLSSLAKVLAADAIHVRLAGKTDTGSGQKLGDRELTVRELLDGVALLPDFYVLDGGDERVDAALLRNCGAMAVKAGMELQAGGFGAAEFVLLEPLALGGREKDWPSMLRSTLAPHVPGLDPISADALDAKGRGKVMLADEELSKLATAQPVLLRTLLSLQNIGTWLQWRTQHGPLWNSTRMGRMAPSLTRPEEQRWMKNAQAMGQSMALAQYPSRQAALLWIGPHGGTKPHTQPLQRAFEEDLRAPGDEARESSPEERLRAAAAAAAAGRAAAAAPGKSEPNTLEGTRWTSTATDGKAAVQLAFGATAKERLPLVLTIDGRELSLTMTRTKSGLTSIARSQDNVLWRLWLLPEPDADRPTKLTGVLMATRTTGATAAGPGNAGAAVPHYFELVPEKN